MPLISSFYGMYINSQDFSCLLENQPFLPKTLAVFWKIGLFYQRRWLSFGKSAFFTKDVKGFSEATIHFIKTPCSVTAVLLNKLHSIFQVFLYSDGLSQYRHILYNFSEFSLDFVFPFLYTYLSFTFTTK